MNEKAAPVAAAAARVYFCRINPAMAFDDEGNRSSNGTHAKNLKKLQFLKFNVIRIQKCITVCIGIKSIPGENHKIAGSPACQQNIVARVFKT